MGPSGAGAPVDPRLLRRSRATRSAIALLVLIGLGQAVATVAGAWLLAGTVAGLVDGAPADLRALLGLAGVLAARGLLAAAQQSASHRASAAVKTQLREELLAARLARPAELGGADGADPSGGALVGLVTRGVEALDAWFSGYLPQLVLAVVVPVVVGLTIGWADLTSLVVVVVTLPLIPVFMVLVGLVTRDRLDARWRAQSRLAHHFADLVAGLGTLQVFGRARSQVAGLRRVEQKHEQATLQTLRVAFLSALVLELLATLSVALVAVGVGLRLVDGDLSLFTGLLVLVLAPEVYLPLRQAGARYHDAADGMAAAEQAFALLDEAPTATREGSAPSSVQNPPRCDGSGRGAPAVQLRDVTLCRGGVPVLSGLSLDLGRGEVVALSGPSGSGKSTLLTALLGHLRPTVGEVLVDGLPLERVDAARWRRRVAWVGQVPDLWPSTVADNVALGTPGAPLTRVRAALDRAGAPDIALDRRVAADGSGFSAGEQRRIALARALLSLDCDGAELLLLDEPTAGLDADTEAAVIHELRRLGVPVLVVSHRPAVLAAADRVVHLPRTAREPSDGSAASVASPGSDGLGPLGSGSAGDGTAAGRGAGVGSGSSVVSPGFDRLSPLASGRMVDAVMPETRALDRVPPARCARGTDTPRDGGQNGSTGRDTVPAPRPSTDSTGKATTAAAAAALGTGVAAVALMATSGWLIARAAEQPPVLHLLVAVTAVRFFGLSRGVLRYLDRLAAHRLGLRHQARARLTSYAVLAGQPVVGRRLGDLVARLVLDTEAAQDRVVRVRMPVVAALGVGALAVTGFALLLPAAAVVLAVYLLLAGVLVPRLAGHVSARLDARIAPLGGELAEAVLRVHRHAVLLHLTGQERRGLDPARAVAARLREAEQRAATARGLGQLGGWLALAGTVVALLLVGGTAVAAGQLSGPALAVLALTPLALHELLLPLVDAEQTRRRTASALTRLADLTASPPTTSSVRGDVSPQGATDHLEPSEVGRRSGAQLLPGPGIRLAEAGIELDGVVVGRTSDLTEPVSLRVRPGRRVVLVGPSGVGKSTLLATLLGQLAPRAGTVAVGGTVGCLTQDAHLFDTTVAENLRLGRPDATDAEIAAVLRRVRLDLAPDRHVGEHGTRLSGGEARRLALARVLLVEPTTVVLDEPTEHLDAETATGLLRDVDALLAGAPVLVVSHQPELLRQVWGDDVEVVRLEPREEPGRPPRVLDPAVGRW